MYIFIFIFYRPIGYDLYSLELIAIERKGRTGLKGTGRKGKKRDVVRYHLTELK